MKTIAVAIFALMAASSASAQIKTAGIESDMLPAFERTNACLNDFDAKAKTKKLSVDTYKLALDGACTTQIRDLRGLYSLSLERSDAQAYLLARFDDNVRDARASMVAAYAMR